MLTGGRADPGDQGEGKNHECDGQNEQELQKEMEAEQNGDDGVMRVGGASLGRGHAGESQGPIMPPSRHFPRDRCVMGHRDHLVVTQLADLLWSP